MKLFRLAPRARGGFTLAELLVVAGITIMLVAIAVAYSAKSRRQVDLFVERAKTGHFMLRAKSLALSTRTRGDLGHPCGYGVKIDYAASALKLFSYSLPPSSSGVAVCVTRDASGEKLRADLEEATADELVIGGEVRVVSGADRLDRVFFLAPDPRTFLWIGGEADPAARAGNVYLETSDGAARAAVRVTPAGEVNF